MAGALGSLAWFSVTGTIDRSNGARRVLPVRVNHDQLEVWFTELGLESSYVPSMIKRIDAWRTATGTRVKHTYELRGKTVELSLEEVKVTDDFVERRMVRVVKGEAGKQHVATLKFIRGGRTARGKRHSGDHWRHTVLADVKGRDRQEAEAFLKEIDTHYKDLSANLHETKVRGILRDYLVKHLHALPVRAGGGVYFVHGEHGEELGRLQQVVWKISGARLDCHPLVDSESARDMVLEALDAKLDDEVRLLMVEIEEAMEAAESRGGRIPVTKFAELRNTYDDISERYRRYVKVLNLPSDRLIPALEMGREAIEGLKEHTQIKSGGGR